VAAEKEKENEREKEGNMCTYTAFITIVVHQFLSILYLASNKVLGAPNGSLKFSSSSSCSDGNTKFVLRGAECFLSNFALNQH
jgi:hypothetical protein